MASVDAKSPTPYDTSRQHADSAAGAAAGHALRKVDQRAVSPQPLEGVERALLLVLHMHHDLAEVDQHPAAVPLALTAYRLGADAAQPVLDLVDDRLHLAVV